MAVTSFDQLDQIIDASERAVVVYHTKTKAKRVSQALPSELFQKYIHIQAAFRIE